MRIEMVLRPGERIDLVAASVLRALPAGVPLHHGLHRLRHPLGVYNTSILKLVERFERVLAILREVQRLTRSKASLGESTAHLPEALDALLDALMEHMEDALSVLSCFFPEVSARNAPRA